MEQFVTLYLNEIRNMKRELLIILAIIVGILLFSNFLIKYIDFTNPPLHRFVITFLEHWFYLFPILFVFSLYRGEKNQPIYQADLLQKQKHKHLLIKFFIFVDALILMTLILFLHSFLMMYDILPRPKIPGFAATRDPRVVISALLGMFSGPFISLSLICTAWSVMQIVKRFKILFGLAIMVAGFLFYQILVRKVAGYGKTFIEIYSYDLLFTLCLGGIFCAVGIYLYKKFGEV